MYRGEIKEMGEGEMYNNEGALEREFGVINEEQIHNAHMSNIYYVLFPFRQNI